MPDQLKSEYNANNGFSSSMQFVNSSGVDLLLLMADGMRLRSPMRSGRADGNCYFKVRYVLGGNVDFDISWRAEQDSFIRNQLEEIEALIAAGRRDPITGHLYSKEVTIDFYYRIECTELDQYKHGVWIPVLGIHLFVSNGRDSLCKHYGRSMYTEVIAFNNDFANQEEVSQATGCGVVYFVSNPTDKDPIIISNRHFSGTVQPTYDPGQKPGVYIYNVGQRNDATNKQLTDIIFIPTLEFSKNGIFRSKDELEAALDAFARNLKNPKDTVEYKELLENIRQTFPEFYKRYDVPRKPFDLTSFMTDLVAGISAASKVKSAIGG